MQRNQVPNAAEYTSNKPKYLRKWTAIVCVLENSVYFMKSMIKQKLVPCVEFFIEKKSIVKLKQVNGTEFI